MPASFRGSAVTNTLPPTAVVFIHKFFPRLFGCVPCCLFISGSVCFRILLLLLRTTSSLPARSVQIILFMVRPLTRRELKLITVCVFAKRKRGWIDQFGCCVSNCEGWDAFTGQSGFMCLETLPRAGRRCFITSTKAQTQIPHGVYNMYTTIRQIICLR